MGGLKKGIKKIGKVVDPVGSLIFGKALGKLGGSDSEPAPVPAPAAEPPPPPAPASSIVPETPVMPLPDDESVRIAKRRSRARQAKRHGRLSTIFTGPDESIGLGS